MGLATSKFLHGSRVTVLGSDDGNRIIGELEGDFNSLYLFRELVLKVGGKRKVHLLELSQLLFGVVILRELEASLGNVNKFLSGVFSKVAHGVFIDVVVKEEDFVSLLEETLDNRALHQLIAVITSNEVNAVLALAASINVFIE